MATQTAARHNGCVDRVKVREMCNRWNGSTLMGLVIARLGGCRFSAGPEGLIFAEDYRLKFPIAGAFTVGNVIITPTSMAHIEERFPGTTAHEAQHATQYAYTLGIFFLPLYVAMMAWSWVRTGDRASACFFEVEAGLDKGGYIQRPLRPFFTRKNRSSPET